MLIRIAFTSVLNHAIKWPEFMFASVTDAAKVRRIDADLPRAGMLNNE